MSVVNIKPGLRPPSARTAERYGISMDEALRWTMLGIMIGDERLYWTEGRVRLEDLEAFPWHSYESHHGGFLDPRAVRAAIRSRLDNATILPYLTHRVADRVKPAVLLEYARHGIPPELVQVIPESRVEEVGGIIKGVSEDVTPQWLLVYIRSQLGNPL